MSSETTHTTEAHAEHEEHGMDKKRIWRVFWILTGITAFEFVIALGIAPRLEGTPAHDYINPVYIVLTLCKAYFIVAFFMHLKFEKAGMIMAIILPVLFIIGLILALTNESHYWIGLRHP